MCNSLLKAIFCLHPYFRVVFVRAEHAFIASKPIIPERELNEVIQRVGGSKPTKPTFMVEVEIGEVGEL